MEEKKPMKLFREKSLEAIESPESLNDYLRVTSVGVWLVLAAVIALLVGAILWSVLGRIETTGQFAVAVGGEGCVCYVPYDQLQQVVARGVVSVNGAEYTLESGADAEVEIVSEDMNPYLRVAGGLSMGDVTVRVPVKADLPESVYTGTVVLESLKPISLLMR